MFDPAGERTGGEGTAALRRALAEAGVPIRTIAAESRLVTGEAGLRLTVLHPPPAGIRGSDNANSIVLLIEYAGRRILLTGDLEPPGLEALLAELPVDCDVVLAPHHGSPLSDPAGFAAWSSPEWVIVSGAGRADVEAAFRRSGADVLVTDETGMVRFTVGQAGVRVERWLGR
jgi:competence protein ComEC